jgi:hypothetical protein
VKQGDLPKNNTNMSTNLIEKETEHRLANTGISVFDSGQFEQMWNIAGALSQGSLIPDTLKGKTADETKANCLRVVEQAARWGLSPFAVMDSASVVHGRLMWEGKLIAAAIKATLNVRLRYTYDGSGEARKVTVSGVIDGIEETIEGTVADWKTTGKGSPWDNLANRDQMLAYRGARQWARRHAPEVILGVYAPDEFEEPEMVNVTNGRTPAKRETPIIPGKKAEEPQPEPAKEKLPPPTVAAGRQKKDRQNRMATLTGITERTGNGKTWWAVGLKIGTADVEMTTFSESMHRSLLECEMGAKLWITFTKSEKGYALEDYVLQVEEEGGLV